MVTESEGTQVPSCETTDVTTCPAGTFNSDRTKCLRLTCFVDGCNGEHVSKLDRSDPTTPIINIDGNEADDNTGRDEADITRCPNCGTLQQWHYCRECDFA